ncbi:MAG: hypothetical protein PHD97_04780 [Bacteroidales bacterium]|nr:hypothetical protein [Bacteroidales bacterium]
MNKILISIALLAVISAVAASCCCFHKCCKSKKALAEYKSIGDIQKANQGPCQKKLECEDKPIKIKGYVDYGNVYFKSPSSYDKFFLKDKENNTMIEVKTIATDNTPIFDKLKQGNGEKILYITGIAVGFDAATNNNCKRVLSITIDKADDIFFEK